MKKMIGVFILLFAVILIGLDQRTIDTLKSRNTLGPSDQSLATGVVKNGEDLDSDLEKRMVIQYAHGPLSIQIQNLKEKIISPFQKGETRQRMLFSLTQMGAIASEALAEIAKSEMPTFANAQNPHSSDAYQQKFELSLRVTALEALDQMVLEKPELSTQISEIASRKSDPVLKFLAQISLSGIQNNQPGKLKRTLQAMLNEADQL